MLDGLGVVLAAVLVGAWLLAGFLLLLVGLATTFLLTSLPLEIDLASLFGEVFSVFCTLDVYDLVTFRSRAFFFSDVACGLGCLEGDIDRSATLI